MSADREWTPEPRDDWSNRAACAGADLSAFFPEQSENISMIARRVCGGCEVRAECLEFALQTGSKGWWGGTGEGTRKRILRERREAAA